MNYYRQERKSNGIKILILSIIGLVIGIIGYLGFDKTSAQIVNCEALVKKYVLARYEEETCEEDEDGFEICDIETSSEKASDVWYAKTVNNELLSSFGEEINLTNSGYYDVGMPPYDNSFSEDYDFDRFTFEKDKTLKVTIKLDNEYKIFDDPIHTNNTCNSKRELGVMTTVKTWYGIPYGT